MTTKTSKDNTVLVTLTAALVAATAATTYILTTRYEQSKERARAWKHYQREKMLKEKTAEARKSMKEPSSGTLIDDVFVDKVFLWEIEDLRKKNRSANVVNHMHFKYVAIHPLASTTLQRKASTEMTTNYNKLITDHECILGDIVRKPNKETNTVAYMRAGPRRYLHFDPAHVNAAIVTCGGLCPGLNNVIREITKSLYQLYAIGGKVYGIRGGYRGFSDPELEPVELTLELVENIHHGGGTVLGSSRGGFDLDKILDFLRDRKISQLFVIGGDGTHRGAFRIHEGCMERGYNVAVAGIPKTIDNDVDYIDQSFGFQSAVEAAQLAIRSAKTEAVCNLPNGVGIVKLMGRSAGFIAAHATMASSDVDLVRNFIRGLWSMLQSFRYVTHKLLLKCLVPEVPVILDGEKGCLPHLMRRVKQQGYAVVVVAEGAGEEVLGTSAEVDASGNKKLPAIGEFMKKSIEEYFQKHGETATVKYIDPSYTVRTVPANAADSLYCMQLAQNAVHGAMVRYSFRKLNANDELSIFTLLELSPTRPLF